MVTFGSNVQCVETLITFLPSAAEAAAQKPAPSVLRFNKSKAGMVESMRENGRTDRLNRLYSLIPIQRERNPISQTKQNRLQRIESLRKSKQEPQAAAEAPAPAPAPAPKPNLSKQKAALAGQMRQGIDKMKQSVEEIANAIFQKALHELARSDGSDEESHLISAVMHSALEEAILSLKMKAASHAKK